METCAIIIIVEVDAMENGYTLIFETWTFKWRLRNTIIKKGFKQTFAIQAIILALTILHLSVLVLYRAYLS